MEVQSKFVSFFSLTIVYLAFIHILRNVQVIVVPEQISSIKTDKKIGRTKYLELKKS